MSLGVQTHVPIRLYKLSATAFDYHVSQQFVITDSFIFNWSDTWRSKESRNVIRTVIVSRIMHVPGG